MRVVSWAMSYAGNEHRWAQMLDTAKKCNVNVELIGVNEEFVCLRQKLNVLRTYLDSVSVGSELIVCIDGFDVLINRPLETLPFMFTMMKTKVLISAERVYTYQYHEYRGKFDQIEDPYKYVNSGTYMGTADSLIEMLDECMAYETSDGTKIDQGLVGMYAYNHMDNKSKIRLDTKANIFWVTTDEWLWLMHYEGGSGGFVKRDNRQIPYFIHNVCNQTWPGKQAHDNAYKIIMGYEV